MELTRRKYGGPDWRKMLSTRRGTVIVSLVFTVIAGGVLVLAMARYRSSVDASGNPETVFVASQLIPKNTPGDVIANQNMFKPEQIVAKQVSSGAIADAAALHGEVAVRDIYPGEQLTSGDFSANGGLPAQLAPTERALTISLDDEHGMLGLVHDGDHVDVYAGASVASQTGQGTPEERLVAEDVPVIKAGSDTSNTGIGGANANSTSPVTLKVPDNEAGQIVWAAEYGKVWLVLRPANATSTTPPSVTTVQSLLFATKPVPNGGKK